MFIFIIQLIMIFSLNSVAAEEINTYSPNMVISDKTVSSPSKVKINILNEQTGSFLERQVIIHGKFMGWKGGTEPPNITRSDWAIEDDTGTIYITGLNPSNLNPYRDIGKICEVIGVVKTNKQGTVYIHGDKINILMDIENDYKVKKVSKSENGVVIEIQKNDVLQIELSGTPTSGFWWHFDNLSNDHFEIIDESTRIGKSEDIDGALVWGIWKLRSIKSGRTKINMIYHRSWDKKTSPLDSFLIEVVIY